MLCCLAMGQTIARVFNKSSHHNKDKDFRQHNHAETLAVTPFVFCRRGSMFFDEDGDLAHEFYEETKTSKGTKMRKRSSDELKPQGDVQMPIPRIRVDLSVILYEVQS